MNRTEQAFVKRLNARRARLLTTLRIIHVWLISPWCAQSAEEMCQLIARQIEESIADEEAAARKESERQGGAKV